MSKLLQSVLGSVLASAILAVGAAGLNLWINQARMQAELEQLRTENVALRAWLTKVSDREIYYHGQRP